MYIIRTRKCLEYRLLKEAKRGRLLDLDCVPRQIGKSTLLKNIAEKNSYLVVCSSMLMANAMNRALNTNVFIAQSNILNRIGGNKLIKGLLVDDLVSPDIIRTIKERGLLRGGVFTKPLDKYRYGYIKDGELVKIGYF